jgi:hypothetical protein
MANNWFENKTWNEATETAFLSKLQKADDETQMATNSGL